VGQLRVANSKAGHGGIMGKSRWNYNKSIIFHTIYIFALSIITILIYGNSLKNKFIYDDNIYIVGNPTYKYFDTWKLFFTPFNPANGVEYLPVRDFTFAIDYLMWGENPAGFHFSNLVIYLLTGIICYILSFELLNLLKIDSDRNESSNDTRFISFLITLFYIIHPLHSQVVSFINQRNALLSGFFSFLTVYLYLRFERSENTKRKIILYCISLLFCLLALFSKATSVTLPVILLLVAASNKNNKTWPTRLLQLTPFFLMGFMAYRLISSVARHTNVIRPDLIEFGAYSLPTKLATAVQIPYFYLYKLFFPFNLAPEYDATFAKTFLSLAVIAALCATILVFRYAWKTRERYPYLLFSLCWFFITLVPVLNLMPTQPVVADRYAYLPSYAFCFAISVSLYMAVRLRHLTWLKVVCIFYLAILSVVAFHENTIWKDEKTLFTTMIQRAPNVSNGYANLGYLYFNEKQYDKAFGLLQQAYLLDPSKPDYELKHGTIAFREKHFEEAIDYYKKALAIDDQSLAAHYFMGISYSKIGDYKSALMELQNVLDSNDVDNNAFRPKATFTMHLFIYPKLKPELDLLRASIPQNPNDLSLHRKLADTLLRYGMLDEALEQCQEIRKRDTNDWQVLFSMAKIYRHRKDWQTAMACIKQALALKPQEGILLTEMGTLNMAVHDTKEALIWFGQISPQEYELYALSRYYTAVCYFQRGNREKAEYYFGLVDKNYPELILKTAPYTKKLAALQ
jgi:tetratricopeptide (TPR) repeat protein